MIRSIAAAIALCCVAPIATAGEQSELAGIQAFIRGCLMAEPSFEKVHDFATQQGWKVRDEHENRQHGEREGEWVVSTADQAHVFLRLQATVQPPHWDLLSCEVVFPEQRDKDGRVERAFMEQVARRPNARNTLRGVQLPDRKRLDYRDGAVQLGYYDGPLADPQNTPWILLSVLIDRKI
jgi:hypothetical protein